MIEKNLPELIGDIEPLPEFFIGVVGPSRSDNEAVSSEFTRFKEGIESREQLAPGKVSRCSDNDDGTTIKVQNDPGC